MQFDMDNSVEKIGQKIGYAFSYLLFTFILFFVLAAFNKIPATWSCLHVAGITFMIALVGIGLKRFLR